MINVLENVENVLIEGQRVRSRVVRWSNLYWEQGVVGEEHDPLLRRFPVPVLVAVLVRRGPGELVGIILGVQRQPSAVEFFSSFASQLVEPL